MSKKHKIITQIKKHVYLSLCLFFILIGTIYLACAVAITILPYYQQAIAKEFSIIAQKKIDFSQLTFEWNWFRIYAKIYNIDIGKHDEDIHIDNIERLELLVHPIKSLLKLKPDLDKVTVVGGRIEFKLNNKLIDSNNLVQDNKNNQDIISNIDDYINDNIKTIVNSSFINWINANKIYLKNTDLIISYDANNANYTDNIKKYNIEKIKFSNYDNYIYAKLRNINNKKTFEFALNFNKSQQLSKFYFSSDDYKLLNLVNNYLGDNSDNSDNSDNIIKSVKFKPYTYKIWLDIDNKNKVFKFSSDIPELNLEFSNNNIVNIKNINGSIIYKPAKNIKENASLVFDNFNLNLANTDFSINGKLFKNNKDILELDAIASFNNSNLVEFFKDFPLGIIGNDTLDWLKKNIKSGYIGESSILWRGPLNSNLASNDVVFLLQSELYNTDIRYHKDWPVIKNFHGKLTLRGDKLNLSGINNNTINSYSGKLNNNKINYLKAEINNLYNNKINKKIIVNSKISSNGSELSQIINTTPLYNFLNIVDERLNIAGNLNIDLNLNVPLSGPEEIGYDGMINFDNNNLNVLKTPLEFKNLSGNLKFNNNGFSTENIIGLYNNKQAHIQASQINSKEPINIKLTSWFDAKYLLDYYNFNYLNKYINGTSGFELDLNITKKNLTANISSRLIGIDISVPEFIKDNDIIKNKQESKNARFTIEHDLKDSVNYSLYLDNKNILEYNEYKNNSSLNLSTNSLVGTIIFKPNNLITADLSKLRILNHEKNSNLTNNKNIFNNYTNIPNLNLNIKKLYYNNTLIGSAKINTSFDDKNNTFKIYNSSVRGNIFDLDLNAKYIDDSNNKKITSSAIGEFKLKNISALGLLLNTNITPHDIHITSQYKLNWDNNLFDFNYKDVHGDIVIEKGNGKLLNLEPGIARIFSFFNLDSIKKRLRLDFSDVFENGFQFDKIYGNIKLNKGLVDTKDILLESGAADIELLGNVDLINKRYNLQAEVTPHVTSSLPIATAIVATPVAGAAVFLLDKILESPVEQMNERVYSITGPWDNPSVKRIKNKKKSLIDISWLSADNFNFQ